MKKRLLGELIGLARATDGNEHLINDGTTSAIMECLSALEALDASLLEKLLRKVEEEKRNMVPDCFLCANPCGKNSAFDLQLLEQEEPERRTLKHQILFGLPALAARRGPEAADIYYQALIAIGIEGIDLQILRSILLKME